MCRLWSFGDLVSSSGQKTLAGAARGGILWRSSLPCLRRTLGGALHRLRCCHSVTPPSRSSGSVGASALQEFLLRRPSLEFGGDAVLAGSLSSLTRTRSVRWRSDERCL